MSPWIPENVLDLLVDRSLVTTMRDMLPPRDPDDDDDDDDDDEEDEGDEEKEPAVIREPDE
jgi:hypothetical protein